MKPSVHCVQFVSHQADRLAREARHQTDHLDRVARKFDLPDMSDRQRMAGSIWGDVSRFPAAIPRCRCGRFDRMAETAARHVSDVAEKGELG